MGEIDGVKHAWAFAEGGMGAVSRSIANAAEAHGATILTEKVKRCHPSPSTRFPPLILALLLALPFDLTLVCLPAFLLKSLPYCLPFPLISSWLVCQFSSFKPFPTACPSL